MLKLQRDASAAASPRPSAHSTWQVLGYRTEAGGEEEEEGRRVGGWGWWWGGASSSRTVFDICHDRNTVRGEEKRQVEGREGKRENGGVVIDARKKKKN